MGGVQTYVTGTVTVINGFPHGEKRCKWCRFCHTDDSMRKRERCVITDELLYDVNTIGIRCPMEFTGDEAKTKAEGYEDADPSGDQ